MQLALEASSCAEPKQKMMSLNFLKVLILSSAKNVRLCYLRGYPDAIEVRSDRAPVISNTSSH